MKTEFEGVHQEFVRVLQGASTLYRFGSDRINNADDYLRKHARAMCVFQTNELHPDTVAMYRTRASELCAKESDNLRVELGCWTQFGRAVALELGCLVSYADPRPEHGNEHILRAIQKLKADAELGASLSEDELKTILEKRGIDTAKFLGRCHQIIENAQKDSPLRVEVAHGKLSISLGVDRLDCFLHAPQIEDKEGFANDVAMSLSREREDGSTILTDLLKKVVLDAVEHGSPNVSYSDPYDTRGHPGTWGEKEI